MTPPDALYLRHMLDAIDRVIEATQRAGRFAAIRQTLAPLRRSAPPGERPSQLRGPVRSVFLEPQAFERAVAILEVHREAFTEGAERLLECETLRGDELPTLIAEPAGPTPGGPARDPRESSDARREAADRRDIERADDEGMTVAVPGSLLPHGA